MKKTGKQCGIVILALMLLMSLGVQPVLAAEAGSGAGSPSASSSVVQEAPDSTASAPGSAPESVPGSAPSSLPSSAPESAPPSTPDSEVPPASSLPQDAASSSAAGSSLPPESLSAPPAEGMISEVWQEEENNGLLDPEALGDITAPVLKSVKVLTPRVSSPGTLQVELDLVEDGSGVNSIYLWVRYRLDNGKNASKSISWSAQQSGPPLMTGKQNVTFSLDGTFPMTDYQIETVQISDAVNNNTAYSSSIDATVITELLDYSDWKNPVKIPVSGQFVVANSQTNDSAAPIVKSVAVLTTQVSSPGTLNVEFDLVEDGSGVDNIYIWVRYRLGNGKNASKSLYWSAQQGEPLLMTGKNTVAFPVDATFPTTDYQIETVQIKDAVNNNTAYSSSVDTTIITELLDYSDWKNPVKIPVSGQFSIVSSSVSDLTAPELRSVSVKATTLQAPGLLPVELDLVEDDSGVDNIYIWVRYRLANGKNASKNLSWSAMNGGAPLKTGKQTVLFPVDPTFMATDYQIETVQMKDAVNNNIAYSSSMDVAIINELFDYSDMKNPVKIPVSGQFTVQNENRVEVISTTHDPALLDKIKGMPAGGMAVVDYSYNSTAAAALFSAIAGQDKTLLFQKDGMMWQFRGQDIDPAKIKDINLDVQSYIQPGGMYGFTSEETVMVMHFPDNGELPGTAYIRVYTEYLLNKYNSGAKEILVTWFVDGEPASKSVPTELQGDNYVVFPLTHNSTFILSSTQPNGGQTGGQGGGQDGGQTGGQWMDFGGRWCYQYPDGSWAYGWAFIDRNWYYFDDGGYMQTGWLWDGASWYYLHGGGQMATGWLWDGASWYYMNGSGQMQTGWLWDGASWYYMNGSGQMQTGWLWDGASWFYMDGSGRMVTGQYSIDGKANRFAANGVWLGEGGSGQWVDYSGRWCYQYAEGSWAYGWAFIEGSWYYFDNGGYMQTGWLWDGASWYYLYGSGRMATGWLWDGASWYYLHGSGQMAAGWLWDGADWYYMNGSGQMQTGWLWDGASWFYLHGSGQMATGQAQVGGETHNFAANGVWLGAA